MVEIELALRDRHRTRGAKCQLPSAKWRTLTYTLPMRVLGIDCGTEYTGYGVVELCLDGTLACLSFGVIKLSVREPLPTRLSTIYDRLGAIIQEHRPDQVAIEDVFYAVNVKSA